MWSFRAQLNYVPAPRYDRASGAWVSRILVYETFGKPAVRVIEGASFPGSSRDYALPASSSNAFTMAREHAAHAIECAIANDHKRRRAEPVLNVSVKKNGGMWFAKLGRICLTFCISRRRA